MNLGQSLIFFAGEREKKRKKDRVEARST